MTTNKIMKSKEVEFYPRYDVALQRSKEERQRLRQAVRRQSSIENRKDLGYNKGTDTHRSAKKSRSCMFHSYEKKTVTYI